MRTYFVIAKMTCNTCGGDGFTKPYLELYLAFEEYCLIHCGDEDFDHLKNEWMADHGWPGGEKCWPAQKTKCPDCHGKGEIESKVPLEEALKQLGVSI